MDDVTLRMNAVCSTVREAEEAEVCVLIVLKAGGELYTSARCLDTFDPLDRAKALSQVMHHVSKEFEDNVRQHTYGDRRIIVSHERTDPLFVEEE